MGVCQYCTRGESQIGNKGKCLECHGSGKTKSLKTGEEISCPLCGGTGKCNMCNGTGQT